MAGCAIFRGGLVKQDRLGRHEASQLVALCAANILVRAPQRELRPLVVIKSRGLPLHAVMALGAAGNIRLRKLLPVDILVAVLALGRRSLEIHVNELGFQIRGLMAVHASGCSMRPQQGKLRF